MSKYKREWNVVKGEDLKDADGGPLRTRLVANAGKDLINICADMEETLRLVDRVANVASQLDGTDLPDEWSVKLGHVTEAERAKNTVMVRALRETREHIREARHNISFFIDYLDNNHEGWDE